MIDVAIGDEDGRDRRLPLRAARMQARRRDDLLAEIRRRVQEQPSLAVAADRQARLAARLDALIAAPGELADRAEAIPLRKAAAGCRTKNDDMHCKSLYTLKEFAQPRLATGLGGINQISAEA